MRASVFSAARIASARPFAPNVGDMSIGGGALKRVVSRKVRASQYDHSTGQCRKKRLCDRWRVIDGHRVLRDLHSAFLISHVTGRNLDDIARKACCDDGMNFLKLQDEVLKTCDKSLGIF